MKNAKETLQIVAWCALGIFIFMIFVMILRLPTELEFEYVGSFTMDTSEPGWWGCNWTILKKHGFWDIEWLDELLQPMRRAKQIDFEIDPDCVYVYCCGYTLDRITHRGCEFMYKLHLDDCFYATAYLRPDYDHPDRVNLYVLRGDAADAIERDLHNSGDGHDTEIWCDGEYVNGRTYYYGL